jgi:hypothetical protein
MREPMSLLREAGTEAHVPERRSCAGTSNAD